MKRPATQAPQFTPTTKPQPPEIKTRGMGRELADLVRKGLIDLDVVKKRTDRVAVAAMKDLKERP